MAEENLFSDLAPSANETEEPQGLFSDLAPQSEVPAPRTEVPAAEEDEEGFFESIGRGIITAPVSILQGVSELAAIGLDQAFDTNTLRPVTDFFEGAKENIEPERAAGKAAEEVFAFGLGFIPIAGWVGRAGQVARTGQSLGATSKFMKSAEAFGKSKAGKKLLSTRGGMYGTTAVGAGLYEGFVSPSGRATLSDSVSFLPEALKTEPYQGEEGRAESGRQLRNKLRQVAEASALSAGFDTLLYGVGQAGRQAAKVPGVAPTLSAGARGITNAFDFAALNAAKVPGATRSKQLFDRYFSSTKGADPAVVAGIRDAEGLTKAEKNQAIMSITRYQNAVKKAARRSAELGGTKAFMKEASKDAHAFLLGMMPKDVLQKKYGNEFTSALEEAAKHGSRVEDAQVKLMEDGLKAEKNRFVTAATQIAPGVTLPRQRAIESGLKNINEMKELQKNRQAHLTRIFQVHQNPVQYFKELGPDFMESAGFKAAVDDALKFTLEKSPTSVPTAAARENAKNTVLDIIGLSEVARGADPQDAIKQVLKRQKGEMNKLVTERAPLFKLSEAMLIGREPIIDKSPAIRAFMGEIDDPATLLTETINRGAENVEALRFYRDIMKPSSESAAEGLSKLAANQGRPVAISIPNAFRMTPSDYEKEVQALRKMGRSADEASLNEALSNYGYKKLGEFDENSVFGGRFGEMSGVYVPEEIYANLTSPVVLSSHPASQLAAIVNQLKGLSQKMLIIPNIASRIRDILGNALMRVATGNAPNLYDQSNLGAAQTLFRDVSNLTDEGQARFRLMMDAAGVTDSNVMLKRIQDLQAEGPSRGAAGAFRKGVDFYESLPGQKQILKFFEKITDGVDGYSKATVMLGEKAKLDEIFEGANVLPEQRSAAYDWMERSNLARRTSSPVLSPATVGSSKVEPIVTLTPNEVIAADRTKAMMPTYNELGDAVTATDRTLPFGNFTSFASENIRNITNIFTLGLNQLAAEADKGLIDGLGKENAEAFVRLNRAQGLQRLTGLLTVAAIAPKAMVRASMNATDTTEEQMDRLHENVAPYLEGHDLVVLDNDGEGGYEWIDLSYVAPYSFVVDPINAAIRTYQERGRLNASEVDQLANSAWSAISSLADPFASESIVFERIRDALPSEGFPGIGRGGVTAMGSPIYIETDDLGTKVKKGFVHIMDSLAPAYLKLAGEGRKGEIEPGRLSRALMNTPGARGEEYNSYEELARQVTGFTPMKLDMKKDFEFVGKEYTPKRGMLKTQANRVVVAPDATVEDMQVAWNNYLDGLYRVQSELYNKIQGARTLGLSDDEILRNLIDKAKLGSKEVYAIMDGEFYPTYASDELDDRVIMEIEEGRNRLVTEVPYEELDVLTESRLGQPLSPELFRERRSGFVDEAAPAPAPAPATASSGLFSDLGKAPPASGGLFSDLGAAPAAPVTGSMPARATPQSTPAPARNAPPSPSLLGSDPISQARNAEIAQRLSGQ